MCFGRQVLRNGAIIGVIKSFESGTTGLPTYHRVCVRQWPNFRKYADNYPRQLFRFTSIKILCRATELDACTQMDGRTEMVLIRRVDKFLPSNIWTYRFGLDFQLLTVYDLQKRYENKGEKEFLQR